MRVGQEHDSRSRPFRRRRPPRAGRTPRRRAAQRSLERGEEAAERIRVAAGELVQQFRNAVDEGSRAPTAARRPRVSTARAIAATIAGVTPTS
ncbi:MAG: hypothetical protein E6G13_13950, partial [Actinobacteria bacterium]